jgi:hypothetical protein
MIADVEALNGLTTALADFCWRIAHRLLQVQEEARPQHILDLVLRDSEGRRVGVL